MELEWNFVKMPLIIENLEKLETEFKIQLPSALKKVLYRYHGGRPNKRRFTTNAGKERVIKTFLPVTEDYNVNVYLVKTWLKLPNTVFPFANTPSGDYLCLNNEGENEPFVVLYHHEIDALEYVSESFEAFLDSLY